MNLRTTLVAVGVVLLVGSGCRHRWSDGPEASPSLERKAQRAAKRAAAIDLDCTKLTASTRSIASTGEFTSVAVEIEGCGRTEVFDVTCANGICTGEPR